MEKWKIFWRQIKRCWQQNEAAAIILMGAVTLYWVVLAFWFYLQDD